jgi:hypothetical protein
MIGWEAGVSLLSLAFVPASPSGPLVLPACVFRPMYRDSPPHMRAPPTPRVIRPYSLDSHAFA